MVGRTVPSLVWCALALSLALWNASWGQALAPEERARRLEENQPVLHLGRGAELYDGSFESGALEPWQDESLGLVKVRQAGPGSIPTAAHGEWFVHLELDLVIPLPSSRPDHMMVKVEVKGDEISPSHGLTLSWRQRGPRPAFRPLDTVRWQAHYTNADGRAVDLKQGSLPAPREAEWAEASVSIPPADPKKNWDGAAVVVRLGMQLATTDSSGVYEGFIDDIRLSRRPLDNWVVRPWFYPSLNQLRIDLDNYQHDQDAAVVSLADSDGKRVWSQSMPVQHGRADAWLEVPGNLEGVYTLTVESSDGRNRYTYPIHRQRFAWEGNTLGVTDEVLPPFEPLAVDGHKARVVLREYAFDGLGLFSQIDSVGAPLLARPMRLVADGQALAAEGRMVSNDPQQAVYEGHADAGRVQIATRTTLEYDGCAKVELTLAPLDGNGGAELETLVLEIPLRDESSPLWHVCRDFLRTNLAGKVPAGEGPVWTNQDFNVPGYYGGDTSFWGRFLPYIWIGDDARGLAWFADNDLNWGSDPEGKKPFLSLHREGAELLLRVHLVQVPTAISRPRTITFGLMASPAKPMPADWRQWVTDRLGVGWVGSQYFGTQANFNAKYPWQRNYGLLDASLAMRQAHARGEKPPHFNEFIQQWHAGFKRPVPEDIQKRMDSLARTFMETLSKARLGSAYFEEFNTSIAHEEMRTFGFEWTAVLYPWFATYLDQFGGSEPESMKTANHGMHMSVAPSYIDFATWHAAEFIRRGVGIYFDNTFARRVQNWPVSPAYRSPHYRIANDAEQGIQPSAQIWAQREYLKRIWVMHQTLGPEEAKPLMIVHMTNAHIIPYLSFNQTNLDLEWDDRPIAFQRKYAPELLRAETSGVASGNYATMLANLLGAADRNVEAWGRRTRDGGALVHNVSHAQSFKRYFPFVDLLRTFGFDAEDVTLHNYWQRDYPLQVSDDKCKTLLAVRPAKALIVLCTWNDEPTTLTIRVAPEALPFAPAAAVDPEFPNGQRVPPTHQSYGGPNNINFMYAEGEHDLSYQGDVTWDAQRHELRVPLRGHGVRMIVLE